ncbi:acetolactate synthase large subunit [Pseudorhodoferax soli]|uniref:Acetolactate synthase-1/2/3 large subunit n=1 Tax=Pseudorhodoferax soli TaxID=545864 RepID=A0A368X6K5_9BURK|nr:acetolactate synthase large subunit [Pseudorhodoferax soli]RCW63622.1 acetolactate synthase-1/2/3 large subunit [Pseudorhodoferax soli]
MNGAEALVHSLLDAGVDTCFANPGTSEMHFVAALDRIAGMRCVLGLFEGVVTGAADGYYRLADRPAATLLHLGPGLANGLANLHNAKKAHSGIVNVVGEHATAHLELDAPLTSDVEGVARPMSHWVHTVESVDKVANAGRAAVSAASARPGQIASLILPADKAWSEFGDAPAAQGAVMTAAPDAVDAESVLSIAKTLRSSGKSTLLLLGGPAVREGAAQWAGRIAAATGCAVMCEFYAERISRGAGRFPLPRLPYSVDAAVQKLAAFEHIVLVGAMPPVAFFAYPNKPGRLYSPGTNLHRLAHRGNDVEGALRMLAEATDATRTAFVTPSRRQAADTEGPLTPASIGALLATLIPENAVVVDEAVSTGRGFDGVTHDAAPHEWLTTMGGSIGYALPVAVGAAIAAPERKVVALVGDGSAMYTLQALWTMAREGLDVTTVIFANRTYQILRGEFANVGAGEPGARATDMLTIDRPALDWVSLARGHGVGATRVTNLAEFAAAMRSSLASGGPSLIEVIL